MYHRIASVACTLLLGAVAASGAYAADQSTPFTGLGHEGSGLQSRYDATHPKPKPPVNPFTGLGHEGSGLQTSYDATHRKVLASAASTLPPTYDWAKIRVWLS
jgi:opacity protein-like surface antigen